MQEAKYQIAILEQELSELRNALRKLKPQSQKENEFAPIKVFEAEPKVSLSDSLFDSQGDYNPIYHQRRQEPTQFSSKALTQLEELEVERELNRLEIELEIRRQKYLIGGEMAVAALMEQFEELDLRNTTEDFYVTEWK